MAKKSKTKSRLLLSAVALIVSAVIAWNPINLQLQLTRAKAALLIRDTDTASEHLDNALEIDPESSEAHFFLARTYRRLGDIDNVRRHLQFAQELGFDPIRCRREQTYAMAHIGVVGEGQSQLALVLASDTNDGMDLCESFARGFITTKNHQMADAVIEAWERDYPNDPLIPLFRGRLHLARAESQTQREVAQAALKEFEITYTKAPYIAESWLFMGEASLQLQDYEQAAEHLNRYLSKYPEHPVALTYSGKLHRKTGDFGSARQQLTQALELSPDYNVASLELGQLELDSGNSEQAIAILMPFHETQPWNLDIRHSLATALQESDQIEMAKVHFAYIKGARIAMAQVPELVKGANADSPNADAQFAVGEILMHYNDPAQSLMWLNRTIALDADHLSANSLLATYYDSIGNFGFAKQHRDRITQSQESERTESE